MIPRRFRGPGLAATLMIEASFAAAAPRVWDFDVYLDDDLIGRHSFTVAGRDTGRAVSSAASFNVKLLLMNVYTYEHRSEEFWEGDCLARLSASTNDNGDQTEVDGVLGGNAFRLNHSQQSAALPQCVMTFAYWNPAILRQKQLLNPQTGEYVSVKVQSQGRDVLVVAGKALQAEHYHLDADKFQIDLWYDLSREWVALDSQLENGRRLRYRIKSAAQSAVP